MEMLKHKVCVIGAGAWGTNHIRTLNQLNCLGGIVEIDKKLFSKYSEKYSNNSVEVFNDLNSAIQSNLFDGFVVASPPESHYSVAKEIIESRNHLLVEKPLTLNYRDAKKLLELSFENEINLMVGHVMLFHPAIIKMKDLISSGKIGKLQYIYSNRLNLGQIRKEENVFWSLAPHDISIFQFFTDSYPSRIDSNGGIFIQEKVYDSTITSLEYPNNIKGHIFVSWLHPFKEHRIVVVGSDGMITFEDSVEGKPLKFYNKKFKPVDNDIKKFDGPTERLPYDFEMPLTLELKYFIDHLNGKKINKCSAKSAVEVIKILEEASKRLHKK
tara:strand:+ start:10419 stop:11399 length:981 start_codon:yes stop_codon:yes gene_type:complete